MSKVIHWVDVIAYLPIKKSANIVSRPRMLTIEEESRVATHITSILPRMETQSVMGRNLLGEGHYWQTRVLLSLKSCEYSDVCSGASRHQPDILLKLLN